MGHRDLKSQIESFSSLDPEARTATADGAGVEIRESDSQAILFNAGVLTDGVHTPVVQESDDNSSFSDVAAIDLDGTLDVLATGVSQRVGYKGLKQFIRSRIVVSGGPGTGIVASSTILLGNLHRSPGADAS